jgi:hypothetical protein
MITLFVTAALAGSELSFGYEQTAPAWPGGVQRGLRLAGGTDLSPAVAVGLTGAVQPGGYPVIQQLSDGFPMPSVTGGTYAVGRAVAWGRITPIRSEHGPWSADVGLDLGLGAARFTTVSYAVGTGFYVELIDFTQGWSPTSTVGLSGTMARGPAGLRFRAEHMAYVPRVADRPYAASVVWLGVDLVVRFDR